MLSSICRGLCNPSRFFYDMDRSGNLVETIPCHDEINAMVTLLLWNTHRTMQTEAPLCGCFVKALISHVFLLFFFVLVFYSSINMNLILVIDCYIFYTLYTIVYVSICIAVYVVLIHCDLQKNSKWSQTRLYR